MDASGELVVLGVGSSATVYLARMQGFEVALKVGRGWWAGASQGK